MGQISRRSFLSGTVGAVTAASVLYSKSTPIQATSDAIGEEQWTHPKGNTAYNAHFADGVGPTGEITNAWIGHFAGFHERDSVCVVDGTVYGAGDKLAAFDAADGTTQWEFVADVPDGLHGGAVSDVKSPTVMNGVVFAPVRMSIFDDDDPRHAAMVAVDADSGEKVWRIDAPVGAGFSDVTAVDGTIYTTGPDLDGSWDRFVYALNPSDGSVRWRQQSTVPHNSDGRPGHTPVVADGIVVVKEQTGVRALDATSGDVVWEALPDVEDPSVAMVSDGTLFLNNTAGPSIIALDAATGEQQWKQSYKYSRLSIGTTDAKRLYIQIDSDTDDIIALDRTNGNKRWRTSLPQPSKDNTSGKYVLRRGMARVGELLYVGSVGLNPTDGSIVWTQKIKPGAAAGTVLRAVAGGQMYFRDVGMDSRLIVMKGSQTQKGATPTPKPDDTDQQKDNTAEPSQPDDTDKLTVETDSPTEETLTEPSTTKDSPSTASSTATTDSPTEEAPTEPSITKDSPSTDPSTTTTDGPGFGILMTLTGVGVVAWRYLGSS
ncbi:outer membrane protein assembly factor BamB family protein [Halocatena pleomorpha]|nr:PQQ-binding-like beta-propeller repeat protein [Halocatena pleomorpha]